MNHFVKYFFVLISGGLVFISCSKKDDGEESARKAEQERMAEFNDGIKVQFYRAMKIALRSTAEVGKNAEFDKARTNLLRLGGEALSIAATPDSLRTINPLELLSMAGDFYKAKDVLLKTDEDSLPTILGNVYYVFTKGETSQPPKLLSSIYDNNLEHGIVGTALWISRTAPSEFVVYEYSRTNEDAMGSDHMAMGIKLVKSFVFWEHDFPYAGMDKATEYLALCEKNKSDIINDPFIKLDDGSTGEKAYYQLHGLGYLMKGLNEQKLNKEKETIEDFESFIKDAEKGGLDNELTWLIGSYVYISKEDKEKSLNYLNKLNRSELLEEPEKNAIAETISYVESREKGKAMNKVMDKVVIAKIGWKLLSKRLEKIEAMEKLKETKEGARMMEIQKSMSEKAAYLDKAQTNLNTDSLAGKAGEMLKGLFGK